MVADCTEMPRFLGFSGNAVLNIKPYRWIPGFAWERRHYTKVVSGMMR
jgi:hypothetical protein